MRVALVVAVSCVSVRFLAWSESEGVKVLLHEPEVNTTIKLSAPDLQTLVSTCENALNSAPRGNLAE
jgi:hypothetical protein